MTEYMNLGLFTCEDIKKCEYIVEYTGRKYTRKPKVSHFYNIEVVYQNILNQKTKVYIDTVRSKEMVKYCNHLCDNNANIAKFYKSTTSAAELWVKANRDIKCNNKILVHYGDEFFKKFKNIGGCKCNRCLMTD